MAKRGATACTSMLFMLLALWALSAARPAHAAESYDNCTGFITSLPAVISTQGTWCLKTDLTTAATSGAAITIATNNVTVDCNGFKLGGLGAGAGTSAPGIYASNRLNATVRHCNIRGFYSGVDLIGASGGGHVVEDNRFGSNTYIGVLIQGAGSTVRRNLIFDTGGSTFSPSGEAIGIYAINSTDIADNTISGVVATTGGNHNAYGISTDTLGASTIQGNGIRDLVPAGSGHVYGIYNISSTRLLMRDNDLVGDAGAGSIGLYCGSSNGRAIGNDIGHFSTTISFCTDVSGNDTTP